MEKRRKESLRYSKSQEAEIKQLFQELNSIDDPKRRLKLRNEIVLRNLELVKSIAFQFLGTAEPIEDIIQAGVIGLIYAVERFEPNRGLKFVTFAVPTIKGEIKRYFRDKCWTIKVPRRAKELNIKVLNAQEKLTQELNRPATAAELAQYLNESEEEIQGIANLCYARKPASLDAYIYPDSGNLASLSLEVLKYEEPKLSENVLILPEAINMLPPLEAEVIRLRFFGDLSQTVIAKQLNVSQMQISRIERRALGKLRTFLTQDSHQN